MKDFNSITTWSVSKGIARPKNKIPFAPHESHSLPQESMTYKTWRQFEQSAKQHTYATDVPDGSYSADKVYLQLQMRVNRDLVESGIDKELKWRDVDEMHFPDMPEMYRQQLRIKEIVKEAESPKFGEWISVKDRFPETESLLLTASKKILIGDWYNGVWRVAGKIRWAEKIQGGFELLSDLRTGDITHWMTMPELPSPPKTL